jgi:hypothetical protein
MLRTTRHKSLQKRTPQSSQEVEFAYKKQRRGSYNLKPVPIQNNSQPPSPSKLASSVSRPSVSTTPPIRPAQDNDWIDESPDLFYPTENKVAGNVS